MVWLEVLEQAGPPAPPPLPCVPHFKRALDCKVLALKLEPLSAGLLLQALYKAC